jgi:hypothetical protein
MRERSHRRSRRPPWTTCERPPACDRGPAHACIPGSSSHAPAIAFHATRARRRSSPHPSRASPSCAQASVAELGRQTLCPGRGAGVRRPADRLLTRGVDRDRMCAFVREWTGCAQSPGVDTTAPRTVSRPIAETGPRGSNLDPAQPLRRFEEEHDLQDVRVGETGFEPATARPPAGCATRLRHSP